MSRSSLGNSKSSMGPSGHTLLPGTEPYPTTHKHTHLPYPPLSSLSFHPSVPNQPSLLVRLLQGPQVTSASSASSQNWPPPATHYPEAEDCGPGWGQGEAGLQHTACKVKEEVRRESDGVEEGKPQKGDLPSHSYLWLPSVDCSLGTQHSNNKNLLPMAVSSIGLGLFNTCPLPPLPGSVNSSQGYTQSPFPKASEFTARTCLPIPLQLSLLNSQHNNTHPSGSAQAYIHTPNWI